MMPMRAASKLIYAKEVLGDRINVYQVQGEESFAALDHMIDVLTRVESYHIFAELWVSADPATERHIGHNPMLGSVRTIFTGSESATARPPSDSRTLSAAPEQSRTRSSPLS